MSVQERFHQVDPMGFETLERFAEADNFNRWLFETIEPFCAGHILEAGSGIGNVTHLFLEKNFLLTGSDVNPEYCSVLRQKFGHYPNLKGIKELDLADISIEKTSPELIDQFDTIVALNVIEHIQDDRLAIHNCKKLLRQNGILIILVPAYQIIYNSFDEELGHYTRYTSDSLREMIEEQGFEVIHKQYFNSIGLFGWIINGSIFRRKLIPRSQLQLFDRLVPVVKFIDKITLNSFGLSVIEVAREIE